MKQYGPFLVIVPLSTITAWQSQFQTWAPDLNVITYIGTATAREVIRTYEFGGGNGNGHSTMNGNGKSNGNGGGGGGAAKLKMNVLLTTYEITLRDSKELSDIKWQVLAVDEVRRIFIIRSV